MRISLDRCGSNTANMRRRLRVCFCFHHFSHGLPLRPRTSIYLHRGKRLYSEDSSVQEPVVLETITSQETHRPGHALPETSPRAKPDRYSPEGSLGARLRFLYIISTRLASISARTCSCQHKPCSHHHILLPRLDWTELNRGENVLSLSALLIGPPLVPPTPSPSISPSSPSSSSPTNTGTTGIATAYPPFLSRTTMSPVSWSSGELVLCSVEPAMALLTLAEVEIVDVEDAGRRERWAWKRLRRTEEEVEFEVVREEGALLLVVREGWCRGFGARVVIVFVGWGETRGEGKMVRR